MALEVLGPVKHSFPSILYNKYEIKTALTINLIISKAFLNNTFSKTMIVKIPERKLIVKRRSHFQPAFGSQLNEKQITLQPLAFVLPHENI